MTNRWLLLNFDVLGALAVLITTLFALSGYVDAGLAGVCITSAMSFTGSIYWTCRLWTSLELDLKYIYDNQYVLDMYTESFVAPSSVLLSISIFLKNLRLSLKTIVLRHSGPLRQVPTRIL